MIDDSKTILSFGDELKCKCGGDCWEVQHFKTKEDWDKHEFFKNWENESCANYEGYLLKFKKFNIIVSYDYNSKTYSLTKVDSKVRSNSDPFGKTPEIWKNKVKDIDLDSVKDIINTLKREYKLKKIMK